MYLEIFNQSASSPTQPFQHPTLSNETYHQQTNS